MKYRYILFIGLLGLLFACKPELDEFSASKGNADFSTYVALGNSLTAGYADGALFTSGQENSFPNILALQFSKVGGGNFAQPLMPSEDGVGFTLYPDGSILFRTKTILGYPEDCLGNESLGPKPSNEGLSQTELMGYLFNPIPGSYNNMGVPGAKTFHLLPAPPPFPAGIYSDPQNGNPYYARFASDPGQSVLINEAVALDPTFFSLWIGSNDVLLYAISGGIGDSITEQDLFAYSIDQVLTGLTANGAKGVIANLPGITGASFFNTIPYNGLVLTDSASVNGLNAAYAPLGITFNLGQNPFIIADDNAPGGLRQIKGTEMVLLSTPQDSIKCKGWGSMVKIPDQYTLSEAEIANINNAVNGYNATIRALADQHNLAFVDINSYFAEVESGVAYDGETFTVEYVTGGVFSLDGIHLTKKGYALIANKFIEAINNKYNSTIPIVSATDYPGILFP